METEKNFSETLQEMLRTKGITVEKLSQATGVSDRFLAHLVNGELKDLPAAPYVRGYVLKIAEALNADGEALWKEYLKDSTELRRSGRHDILPSNRFVVPHFNKRVVGIVVVLVLLGVYLLLRLPAIVGAPTVTLFDFEDMRVVESPTFMISGSMDPADELTINDEAIYPDTAGAFSRTVELAPGFNTFSFHAQRFLGKEITFSRTVFYRSATSTAPTSTPYGTNETGF